ncbi:MAG TPA: DUF1501 domain-containing protein [Bacillota bacterium]|nr:DUF1501 domain-containing protein [Bacillota bacterium]
MSCEECKELEALKKALPRRAFLKKGGIALAALGTLGPLAVIAARSGGMARLLDAPTAAAATISAAAPGAADRVLVIVQLAGGNDGLNTVVPYQQGAYYDMRPTIAIAQKDVLPLAGAGAGLNPALAGLHQLYQQNQVAIVQGVGYSNPNLSHFRSMQIWETAQPTSNSYTGWLGRYLDGVQAKSPLEAVAIGSSVPLAMQGSTVAPPAIEALSAFDLRTDPRFPDDRTSLLNALAAMYGGAPADPATFALVRGATVDAYASAAAVQKAATGYKPSSPYPATQLGKQLELVAQLVAGGLPTRIYYTVLGGFDDHANEHTGYAHLLQQLGDAVAAFFTDLKGHGLDQRVTLMTWSEFGRRAKENASGGTDHGTAAPLFVVGPSVKGGLYGEAPSVTNLDSDGNLKFDVDFRQVYATLLQEWLAADPAGVLGGTFSTLPLLQI